MRSQQEFIFDDLNKIKNQLLEWSKGFDHVFWLDSNENTPAHFDRILAVGSIDQITCHYANAFEKLKSFLNDHNDYIFGYLGYDLKNDTENLSSKNIDGTDFEDLHFIQPLKVIEVKNDKLIFKYPESIADEIEKDLNIILSLRFKHQPSRGLDIQQRIPKENYIEKCHHILDKIQLGKMYEMNFCQEFYAENSVIEPYSVYQDLNEISLAPFACFVKNKHKHLLCTSPERFIKKEDTRVFSQPIKGTSKRHPEPHADRQSKMSLRANIKEIAENIMIVDLVRNDLAHVAQKGTVKVDELCEIYSFKQVHQMISTISCKTEENMHPVDIIKACYPMGSMTGAPKIAAMQFIEEFEDSKRGLYSGAVGYFTPDGDFDFNVVIRSILYNAEKKYISYSVGSAITAKANPEQEYEECLLKAEAMRKVLS